MTVKNVLSALVLGVLAPLVSSADTVRIDFSGVVSAVFTPRPGYPELGTNVAGFVVFESPNASPAILSPFNPDYAGYELTGGPTRFQVQIGSTLIDSMHGIKVDVLDNGPSFGFPGPTDSLSFSTVVHNVGYNLWLQGPEGSFGGIAFPLPDVIQQTWRSALRFVAIDYAYGPYQAYSASITDISYSVTSVPEPESWMMLVAGACAIAGVLARRRRPDYAV